MTELYRQPVLTALPAEHPVTADEVAAAVAASGRRLIVLDDDPTGTQAVSGLPVLTSWTPDDLSWALRQAAPAVFVLTNTRSLSADLAASRDREITRAVLAAAALERVEPVFAVRGDSTLRGHFPVEADAVSAVLRDSAGAPDGIVVTPAYPDAGRVTIDSVHWVRTPTGFVPAGETEFARDPAFAYRASDLREYIAEKTHGRWPRESVAAITLDDLRCHGVDRVTRILLGLRDGVPVVADAVSDADLRVLALAVLSAEAAGRRFLYQIGPSFVRARTGSASRPPVTPSEVDGFARAASSGSAAAHGLVLVGSHVARSTAQLEHLRRHGGTSELVLDASAVLDPGECARTVHALVAQAHDRLAHGDVVVSTSRRVVTADTPDANLDISRAVSRALVDVASGIVARVRPGWIVAKGGITSSDIATESLGIRRAWVRGTLLPGIVSLWEPVLGRVTGIPYVVFAGNVGDADSLTAVVEILRHKGKPTQRTEEPER